MLFSTWLRYWKRSVERRWALHQALRRQSLARRRASRPRLEALEDRWLLSTYLVTSTADDGSTGTLRAAINQANMAGSTITEIDFKIGTSGSAQTINLTSQLPTLTANGVYINGLSQGGSDKLITLNGTGAGSSSDGLLLQGSGNIVSGLILSNFTNNGIEVAGNSNAIGGTATGAGNVLSGNTKDGLKIDSGVSGVTVQGNYIGTNTAGTAALANKVGIEDAGNNNTIGGSVVGVRNIISGNTNDGVLIDSGASGNVVSGNILGLTASGSAALANGGNGIEVQGTSNTIGGPVYYARNFIAGNVKDGLLLGSSASGNLVLDSFIGLNITGTLGVANLNGVEIAGTNNTLGSTVSGGINFISGNTNDGVLLDSTATGNLLLSNDVGTDFTGQKAVANSIGAEVAGAGNTIGGTASAARNIVAGNSSDGVKLDSTASGTLLLGNSIGVNAVAKALGNGGNGLNILSSSNTVGGTVSGSRNVISANSGDGILIASGNLVIGNYIGTNIVGSAALGNSTNGIEISGNSNTIGGTASAARNVISGNSGDGVKIDSGASGNQVLGNYVGINAAGSGALSNSIGIEDAGNSNTLGGSVSGARNTIAGNSGDGVLLDSTASGNQVLGNFVGLNPGGTAALSNSGNGVEIQGTGNTIGGPVYNARNFIAGNVKDGLLLGSSSSGNLVLDSFIGLNISGTLGVANLNGVEIAGTNNTLGSTVSGGINYISGNTNDGVLLDSTATGNLLLSNDVGTDFTGQKAVANSIGVEVAGTGNTLGGTVSAARNLVAGNSSDGVKLDSSGSGTLLLGNSIGVNAVDAALANGGNGLNILSTSNTIGGTASGSRNVVSGNSADGILIASGASSNQVLGNYIGTNIFGKAALGNSSNGIEVGGNANTIGGTASAARNIISGNSGDGVKIDSGASGIQVQGNYIGLNSVGTGNISNGGNGIEDAGSSNILGGSVSGARNVVAGNGGDGILLDSTATADAVQGNFLGLNSNANVALANSGNGLEVQGTNNTIGGSVYFDRNYISGNGKDGLLLGSSSSGNQVLDNFIGLDISGTHGIGNVNGVEIAGSNNTLGSTVSGGINYISGNTNDGVLLDSTATGNLLLGNDVGTDFTGQKAVANSIGIEVAGTGNTIGGTASAARNIIAGNSSDGVKLDSTASGTLLLGNSIGVNAADAALANGGNGLNILSNSNTVGGTVSGSRNVISGNSADGILIASGASSNQVLGNYVGLNIFGSAALGNSTNGIEIGGNGNTIGGTTLAARNVVSGNSGDGVKIDSGASGNQVQGNYIGTNVAGNAAVANAIGIEDAGNSNTLGGSISGARNILSGNSGDGVLIDSGASGNQVLGDFLGLNPGGTAPLSNSGNGVEIQGTNNTIGGPVYLARNYISGNSKDGILLGSSASGNLVLDSFIGLNISGTLGVANLNGVEIAGTNNTLGSTVSGGINYISGNSNDGVLLDSTAKGNLLLGNDVGTDFTGQKAVANSIGIEVAGTGNTLGGTVSAARNLVAGNSSDGVKLDSSGSGTLVIGNSIGVNAVDAALANGGNGLNILSTSNTIGGTASGSRNVVSGNSADGILIASGASSNQVLGNYVGLNIFGSAALGNSTNGIEVGGNSNTIGGTASAARNVISANTSDGVLIDSGASGNQVLGNYIGTNAAGNAAMGNSTGISDSGTNNTIGGSVSGARNVISGNVADGILLNGATADTVQGSIVGLNAAGTAALANGSNGIEVNGNGNTIGGNVATSVYVRNYLSGNVFAGLAIDGAATGNQVLGNFIGLDITGTNGVGNQRGIHIVDGSNNTIGGTASGDTNFISGNSDYGVFIDLGNNNVLLGNDVGTDYTGNNAVANGGGIALSGFGNTIGGTTSAGRNIISGNIGVGVGFVNAGGNQVVQGNYIGLNASGAALGNGSTGVSINQSDNTVGGTNSGARNIISGNSGTGVLLVGGVSGNQVLGNYIGTNATGAAAVANGGNGGVEDDGTNDTIGGSVQGAGNVISGNTGDGILLGSTAETVQGNFVGLNAAGTAALANGTNGIDVGGTNNTVGGSALAARNYISGNANDGLLFGPSATGNQVLGNFVGLDITGTHGVGNVVNGIEIAGNNNTIGGTTSGDTNFISGNNVGVRFDNNSGQAATGNVLLGNDIGTDNTGNNAVANIYGIYISGNNNTVGGTAAAARNIVSGNSYGVEIASGATGNQALGNYIGLNASGAALGDSDGFYIDGSKNTIGGTASGSLNIISGNGYGVLLAGDSSGNQVQGNYIGTNAAGNAAVGNSNGIYDDGSGNTIGGSVSGAGNVVSGNSSYGIYQDNGGTGETVQGNLVGLVAAGNAALGNSYGMAVLGTNSTVGGTAAAARNIISGNANIAVNITGSASGNQVLGNYIGLDITGTQAVANSTGLYIWGFNNTIGGTASGSLNIISGNTGDGVEIVGSSGNQVLGNYIGTNAAGNAAVANSTGIEDDGTNNTIGGSVSGAGNVISGNANDGLLIDSGATGNQVLGNYIGTNAAGTAALGNITNGVWVAGSNNTIGGASAGGTNVISGNGANGYGIEIAGAGNLIEGNFVGTDYTGNAALPNRLAISIDGTGNTLGGTTVAARNIISGNTSGVSLAGSGNLVLGNFLGLNASGTAALGNDNGIDVGGSNNTVGGTAAAARNIISGNSYGVLLGGTGNTVLGNYIGTDVTGTVALGNATDGIDVEFSTNNTIGGSVTGARNVISGNGEYGVQIYGNATGTLVQGNYIGTNAAGNAALANGIDGIFDDGINTTIGGSVSGAGNVISGNLVDGVLAEGSGGTVQGNYIGTDATGTQPLANSVGIYVQAGGNTIGGTATGAGNVISGNSNDGVQIYLASGVVVQGNSIGTNATGNAALANGGNGLNVQSSNNTIGGTAAGAGNIIANNGGDGVLVNTGSGNTISQNSIYNNTGGGISLINGANNNIVASTLSSASLSGTTLTVKGTFNAPTASVTYVLEFFANVSGDAEGKIYLGSLSVTPTSTGTQNFTFTTTTTVTGTDPLITATLTDNLGDTSAFSNGVTVTTGPTPPAAIGMAPLSAADQVLASFTPQLSDGANAYQFELSSLAAMWRSKER